MIDESATSDGSWQEKVSMLSQYIVGLEKSGGLTTTTNDEIFEPFAPNSSRPGYQMSFDDEFCVPCFNDQPILLAVLRWLKLMLLSVVRTYKAKPIILALGPFFLGISMGYLLGIWNTKPRRKQSPQLVKAETSISTTKVILQRILVWVYSIYNRVMIGNREINRVDNGRLQADRKTTTTINLPPSKIEPKLEEKEGKVRKDLKSDVGTIRESEVPVDLVPRHVAVIMDGNRRYGKLKYNNATQGHWDGSSKLVEFAKWCIAENIAVLTVYAFSTENWNRDPSEVASLMAIFSKYCDELRKEALERNIKILVLSTDSQRIPCHVQSGMDRMVEETQHCTGLVMNICMSYGSRGELVAASKSLAKDVLAGDLELSNIDEKELKSRLLTDHCGDPDVMIRTSGEVRVSNFLLWQLAYTEFFFLDKPWPAVEKSDLLSIIRSYATGRSRRFGK